MERSQAHAGLVLSIGHGANVRATFIRAGLGELARFACQFLGAAVEGTFWREGCGVGDLVLTCTAGRGCCLAAAFVKDEAHTTAFRPHSLHVVVSLW